MTEIRLDRFNMTDTELKAQVDARKEILADYEQFTQLPYEVQNTILTEIQDNLEWLKGWAYSFNELMDIIKKGNPLKVTRGDFGIHKDLIMIVWGNYYNGTFSPSEIGLEWLEQAKL